MMIERLRSARAVAGSVKRQFGEAYRTYRIPFYRKIVQIPTHMTVEERVFLYDAACRLPAGSVVAEVGSYLGASACFLASGGIGRISKLYCVDTWENDAMSEGKKSTFDTFTYNTSEFKDVIVPLKGRAHDMVTFLNEPIDLLFIDADHSYDAVTSDLKTYLPKVKAGGTILLHDWGWAEGVQRAIREWVVPIQIEQPSTLPNLYSVRIDPRKLV
jgi:predicted O-methyltransferase YrrM